MIFCGPSALIMTILAFGLAPWQANAQQDYPPYQDLYCGDMNCYDLLGVKRDDDRATIAKAYRKLAGKWHPDKFRGQEEKKRAEAVFMRIAAGYDILKEDDSRREYDYMLDNPEDYYGNYYRYYKRRLAPRIDVRVVVVSLVTIISVVQYYSSWYSYHQAISYLASVPKYRIQAFELAKDRLKEDHQQKSSSNNKQKLSREETKRREEALIKQIIADMMDSYGGYERPQVQSILWMKILMFPIVTYRWLCFQLSWIWRFWILGQELGMPEKEYVIRTNLGLTEKQWGALTASEKEVYLSRELWRRDRWEEWQEEEAEAERQRQAESGRSKQERRWLKNNDNRMTFDENYDW